MEVFVVTQIGADDLADDASLEPLRQALAQVARVVADQGQVAHAQGRHGVDQCLGVAAEPKATHHDARAIMKTL